MSGIPSFLYKYMESRHVDGFMEGRVLFSRSDRHKQASGNLTSTQMIDEERRETDLLQAGGALLIRPTSTFPGAVLTEKPLKNPPAEWQDIPRLHLKAIAQRNSSRHYWLWCASVFGDGQLAPCYNADAVVCVDKPLEFLNRLMQAVLDQFPTDKTARVVRGPMQYSPTTFLSRGDIQAAFHHDKSQAFQREYRVCIFGDALVPKYKGPELNTAYVHMGNNQDCCTDISKQLLDPAHRHMLK